MPERSLKVHERPSVAAFQLSARSGAGARSLPGLVTLAKSTRFGNTDSTNAFGLHGLSVGSATIGIVMVPPVTGVPAPCADAVAPGDVLPAHAVASMSAVSPSAATRRLRERAANM